MEWGHGGIGYGSMENRERPGNGVCVVCPWQLPQLPEGVNRESEECENGDKGDGGDESIPLEIAGAPPSPTGLPWQPRETKAEWEVAQSLS